ncbi:hypothetical protein V8D89_004103 [Ganoderma adspersum]
MNPTAPTNPAASGTGTNASTNPTATTTNDGFQPSVSRYTVDHTFRSGDRVVVRICEETIATWRHGTVSDMTKYPPRAETHGQYSYPVEYPTRGRVERGWFNPAFHEIQFDTYLSDIGARRWGWE